MRQNELTYSVSGSVYLNKRGQPYGESCVNRHCADVKTTWTATIKGHLDKFGAFPSLLTCSAWLTRMFSLLNMNEHIFRLILHTKSKYHWSDWSSGPLAFTLNPRRSRSSSQELAFRPEYNALHLWHAPRWSQREKSISFFQVHSVHLRLI